MMEPHRNLAPSNAQTYIYLRACDRHRRPSRHDIETTRQSLTNYPTHVSKSPHPACTFLSAIIMPMCMTPWRPKETILQRGTQIFCLRAHTDAGRGFTLPGHLNHPMDRTLRSSSTQSCSPVQVRTPMPRCSRERFHAITLPCRALF